MSDPRFDQLKKKFDRHDPFMDSHQVLKVRKRKRKIPEWAMDDDKVREILLRSFPKLDIPGSSDSIKAGRWVRIIYLYFRIGMPRNHIAEELNLSMCVLKNVLRRIFRAAREGKKVGRPPSTKTPTPPKPQLEANGERGNPEDGTPASLQTGDPDIGVSNPEEHDN